MFTLKSSVFVLSALFLLFSFASATNPLNDIIRQQSWELTHIFSWAITGSLVCLVLIITALLFCCLQCKCVAKAPCTHGPSAHRDESSLQTRSKFIAIILLFFLAILITFAIVSTCYQGNSQNDVNSLAPFLSGQAANLSNALHSGAICDQMSQYPEATLLYQKCNNVQSNLTVFTDWANSSIDLVQTSINGLVLNLYVLTSLFIFMCLLGAIGACCRTPCLVRFFAVFALWFAAWFIILWMVTGLPTTLIHHDCYMAHDAMAKNSSDLFPSMPIIALIYNLSDGFHNFGQNFSNNFDYFMNNLNNVQFQNLTHDQVKVFQMIRGCLWDGVTLNSTLEAFNLRHTLEDTLFLIKAVSKRLDIGLRRHGLSLPANYSMELEEI